MNLDDRVIDVLRAVSSDLRPQPDPYHRVVARYRARRRWLAGFGLFLAGVAAAAGAVVVPTAGDPPKPPPVDAFSIYNQWAGRLAQSPTRGAVGADAAFVADFAGRVHEHQLAGDYQDDPRSIREIRVLFVDDIGANRIAMVAYVLTGPDDLKWPHANASFAAPRGASAEQLADPAALRGIGDGLAPFEHTEVDDTTVAVVPVGCEFASAPLPEVTDWKPEPTGSYIVRTAQTRRLEWWRVSCDGVVRMSGPAEGRPPTQPPTAEQLDQAISAARGVGDRGAARAALSRAAQTWPTQGAKAPPRLVWSGPISSAVDGGTGPVPFTGQAIVYAAPTVGDGWTGIVEMVFDQPGPDGELGRGTSFSTLADPTDPSSMLVIPLGEQVAGVLVVPPAGTISVRALRNGAEVARAGVDGGGALLPMTMPQPAERSGLVVEAVDLAGAVIGRGEPAGLPANTGVVDRWDQN